MKIICRDTGLNGRADMDAFRMDTHKKNDVYHYILNQIEHHKRMSFREEYEKLLQIFEIDYDERFLFKKLK